LVSAAIRRSDVTRECPARRADDRRRELGFEPGDSAAAELYQDSVEDHRAPGRGEQHQRPGAEKYVAGDGAADNSRHPKSHDVGEALRRMRVSGVDRQRPARACGGEVFGNRGEECAARRLIRRRGGWAAAQPAQRLPGLGVPLSAPRSGDEKKHRNPGPRRRDQVAHAAALVCVIHSIHRRRRL
jgi:hypothetical protein